MFLTYKSKPTSSPPPLGLCLDRTSDNYGNYAFFCSSPGFSKDGVYQSVHYQTGGGE